jgi:hypothetical protein
LGERFNLERGGVDRPSVPPSVPTFSRLRRMSNDDLSEHADAPELSRGPTAEELRAIPIPKLREFYADLAERNSIRVVAGWCGIGHSTLHNFLQGASPHPRVRRLLALYYVTAQQGGDQADGRPEALAALVAGIEESRRRKAVRDILQALEQGFGAGEVPLWIAAIRSRWDV